MIGEPEETRRAQLRSGLLSRYSADAIEIALRLVDDLPGHTQRIVECVESDESIHHRTVSLDIQIPKSKLRDGSHSTTLLVPFLVQPRGRMIDNFDLHESGGRPISLLSRWETEEVCEALIDTRFSTAFNQRPWPVTALTIETARAKLRSIVSQESKDAKTSVREVFRILNNEDWGASAHEVKLLESLCALLSRRYFLCAEVSGVDGNRVVIRFSHDTRADGLPDQAGSRDQKTKRFQRQNLYQLARRLTGQRPFSFRIYTPLALQAGSYHFRMTSPRGFYLAGSEFEVPNVAASTDPHSFQRLPFVRFEPAEQLVIGRGRSGLPFAHMYLAHGNEQDPVELTASVKFLEVPPGSIGLSTVLSLAVTLVLGISWAFLPDLLRSDSFSADLPLVFLALPPAAVIVLQPSLEGLDQQRAPLSARLGLLTAGGLAFVAGVYFLLARAIWSASQVDDAKLPIPAWITYSWEGGMIVGGLLTLYLLWALWRSFRGYNED